MTSVCSQSHLPNHCMNGVVTAKRLYSALRVAHHTLKANLERIQMQEIKAALHTVTHLEQIVQRGHLLCCPGHHLRWALKGKVLVKLVENLSFSELLLLIPWFFVTVPSASMTRLARSRTHSTSSSIGSGESPFSRSVTSNQSDGTQESCESPDVLDRHQTMEVSC